MKRGLFTLLIVGVAGLLFAQNPGSPQQPGNSPMGPNPRVGPPGIANDPASRPELNAGTPQQTKADDSKFVKDAAVGGMTEVALGKLAQEKASSDAVKQFGQKMIDDHSKAGEDLKKAATKANINVPDSIDSKHQARIDKLSKLSGADFDKAYIKDQLKDHREDVAAFDREAQNGSEPAVKEFASKTLPTLQQHLSMVKDLNKGKSTTSMNRSH
jgi:putative membrane protein